MKDLAGDIQTIQLALAGLTIEEALTVLANVMADVLVCACQADGGKAQLSKICGGTAEDLERIALDNWDGPRMHRLVRT